MKVKKFTAKTMPEAMQQIRKELGSDAVILQSKEVKKSGMLGLFKQKQIEVVAALDETPIEEVPKRQQPAQPAAKPTVKSTDTAVLQEIKDLKELLQEQAFTSGSQRSPLFELVYKYLLNQEMEEGLADQLLQDIEAQYGVEQLTSKQEMKQALSTILKDKLEMIPFHGLPADKQIIQFVGPTGVGKTTTLAKVAAHAMLEDKKHIALITMDTYRIAAIDQLKTYARILNVPIEVVYSMDDYKQALQKFREYDYIFVDTAGRNFRNPQYVHELEETIEIEKGQVETVLILSLTAKSRDITDIYKQFEPLGIEKLIFTKLDETLTYGSIFNISIGEKKQILYFTDGQNVPDDLIEPTKDRMVQLLLSGYDND